jgi:hypothetical protein
MSKPFIYVCSLPRTGSTIVAECLTSYPEAFIFNESLLADGHYHWDQLDFLPPDFKGKNCILDAKRRTIEAYLEIYNQSRGVDINIYRIFRDNFVKCVLNEFNQFGVKDLKHSKYYNIIEYFPNCKTIITCRDPKDMFASILHMRTTFKGQWAWKELNPIEMADEFMQQFDHQKSVMQESEHIIVRYEDFCTNPLEFRRIADFTETELNCPGAIGCYTSTNQLKRWEVDLHKKKIDAVSVGRASQDNINAREMDIFMNTMKAYSDFFGY